jgi:predicted nuclease of predicted toxin-antitoxin system
VRVDLVAFLMGRGCLVRRLPKGAPDRVLAATARDEQLVLVTNDEDFAAAAAGDVHGVVLLRVPQGDAGALLRAFRRLLGRRTRWEGHLIVLKAERATSVALPPDAGQRQAA